MREAKVMGGLVGVEADRGRKGEKVLLCEGIENTLIGDEASRAEALHC